jgi:hypothetical protein
MDFESYQKRFLEILEGNVATEPYNSPDYLNYARLNWARQQRWFKTGILNTDLVETIKKINQEQFWIVITEPWCGDAAHTLPFIHKIAVQNPLINVSYVLRDTEPFLIDQYLTRGSRSIPKLIIRNKEGRDLAVWGSRPAGCQLLYDKLLSENTDVGQKKIALQKWYNEDKGQSFQLELLDLLNSQRI